MIGALERVPTSPRQFQEQALISDRLLPARISYIDGSGSPNNVRRIDRLEHANHDERFPIKRSFVSDKRRQGVSLVTKEITKMRLGVRPGSKGEAMQRFVISNT